jgi:hypothetical protein
LSTALLLSSVCHATNVRDHLVSVQHTTIPFSFPPRIQQVQGSGICIDRTCSVVATAYHIQLFVGRANLGVARAQTAKVLSLANQSDTNKADVSAVKRTLSYDVANDVSFVYTKKPVPRKSGSPYSYKLHVGQTVTVAGYHGREFQTREAHIIGLDLPLVIGKAQLKQNLVLDIHLNPGTSGSAVFDERGNLLGMIVLSGVLKFSSGNLTASVALPVRAIARALLKLDPALASAIFNDIPEEEPKSVQTPSVVYEESDLPGDTSLMVPALSVVSADVPNSVAKLRSTSEVASNSMANFITKQCFVQGTQKPLCHELSVVDGQQTFREIETNNRLGKPTGSFPVQKHGVWMQVDWADTLGEVADNEWVFEGSVNNRYLFTFKSAAEDDRCYYEEYSRGTPLFGGEDRAWKGSVDCFEQILTDKDFNVLSVFAEMHPPEGCLTQLVQTAIYYDWIKLEGQKSPVLLPVRERITAKRLRQKHLSYANVSWTDYKEFRADHKIKF